MFEKVVAFIVIGIGVFCFLVMFVFSILAFFDNEENEYDCGSESYRINNDGVNND